MDERFGEDGACWVLGVAGKIVSYVAGVGGVGDSLPDVRPDNGLLEDEFILSRPSSFMISTDTNT